MKGAKEQEMKGRMNMLRKFRFAGPILAFRYRRTAQRDENNGFPFTAAMEWRKAAELSSWITPLANRYWRECERIMQVSRRFAPPIGVVHVTSMLVFQRSPHPQVDPAVQLMVPHQVMLEPAA
jgi:hypothetical protein